MNLCTHNTGLLYFCIQIYTGVGVIDLEGVDMDISLNGQLNIFNIGSYTDLTYLIELV